MRSVKIRSYKSRSKVAKAARAVARARNILRARSFAPMRTGGFYGGYQRRGRQELKATDIAQPNIALSTGMQLTLLNGVAQGTDFTQRIGRKTLMKSLLVRWGVTNNGVGGDGSGDIMRLMVIYDMQSNSAAPSAGDILQSASDVYSPLNLNNRDRFKVLFDRNITLNSFVATVTPTVQGAPGPKFIKIYKKINLETIFSGTGSTIGSISTGSIYLCALAGSTEYSSQFYSRVRYVDP